MSDRHKDVGHRSSLPVLTPISSCGQVGKAELFLVSHGNSHVDSPFLQLLLGTSLTHLPWIPLGLSENMGRGGDFQVAIESGDLQPR